MNRQPLHTENAPAAIGPYSQAVRCGNTLYCSGQIPLDPATMELVEGDVTVQARRVFDNLTAVLAAADSTLDNIARLGIFLTDLGDFAAVNAVMAEYFNQPYPARSTIEVSALPRGARVEVDAIAVLD
jgi:reactive intermediate/imine deaminase